MVEVREATVDDAERIAAINAAAWRRAYRGIVADDFLDHLPVGQWAREIGGNIANLAGDSFSRVAEIDGAAAGSCYVAAPGREEPPGSSTAELAAIYVDPSSWRRGVGGHLLSEAIAEAGRRGYGEMLLWTFEANRGAQALYRASGFAPDGGTSEFLPVGAPTIRMRRELSSP
jgi:GNAT superfamily N-acetyltransferase